MAKSNGPLSGSNLGPNQRARAETFLNGRQDQRRLAGVELGWWSQALSHAIPPVQGPREDYPANIWWVGDSFTECYGTTDDYHKWTDLTRQAIQGRFRSGGVGYIPIKHTQGVTWGYTSNPDGKNVFATTSGAETDNVDYGFGFGRRCSWMAVNCVKTGTIDCDRFWVVYTSSTAASGNGGSFTIDVDAGTPAALSTSFSTATTGPPQSGRIWDSSVNGALTLTQGTHTIKITCTGTPAFLDGVSAFWTDVVGGIHLYEGGHSGYVASDFDPTAGASGLTTIWADLIYQPYTPTIWTNLISSAGTGVVTSASATFTDRDIGEYIWFAGTTNQIITNNVARIISRQSGTQVTVDRNIPSATYSVVLNRAEFTDGVVNSGQTTMTSATAAFNPWDVGMYVQGATGIPAGTYIRRWNSATSVELSTPATVNQTAQTIRILGRQRNWCAPDLLQIEFGQNDMAGGYSTALFKTGMRNIAAVVERACIGFPVGSTQRYRPSIQLMGIWAPGWTLSGANGVVSTISGQKPFTSETFDFDQADVGKTIGNISNTPIGAGNTIASVQDNRNATLTNNAVATSSVTIVTITSRVQQERHWMRMRQAIIELCQENNWRLFDLYSLGGFINSTDPLNLTFDLGHPSNKGSQWVSNELDEILTGQPRNSSMAQGLIDAKGDLIVGSAADLAGKLSAGIDGQVLTYASGAPLGVLPMDVSMSSGHGQILPVIGGTTALAIGLPAPTLTATVTNADDNEASWLNFATSTVQFNPSGIVSAAFTVTRSGRLPGFYAYIKTDPTLITSVAYAIGLSSASLDVASAIAPAAAVVGAYFLYNTTAHGTAFWRTVTSDGGTRNTQTTTTAIAANTTYKMRIAITGVRGTSISAVAFYINDVLVATHATNLPTFSTALGYGARVEALAAAAARNLKVARIGLSNP